MRRLSKPYSTSIDGSFQIVKERKNKRSETRCCASLNPTPFAFSCLDERWVGGADRDRRHVDLDDGVLLRKEVIQPHLPVRLPCYDFTPIADPTFDGSLPRVGPPASGVTNFRGVTGGVYKTRERIHRSNADLRLLATPTSRSRVADCDPN